MTHSVHKQLIRLAKHNTTRKARYSKSGWPFDQHDTVFLPVRHFNSATPITPGLYKRIPRNVATRPLDRSYGGATHLKPELIGGGYFLGHKGRGIAVDPGYEFVDALHRYHNVTVYHIDTVIISHDHMDHHADLETIINLRRGASSGPLKIVTNREVIEAYGLDDRERIEGVNIAVYDVAEYQKDNRLMELITGVEAKFLPCMHWQRVRKLEFRKNILQAQKVLQKHFNAFGLQLIIEKGERRILISGDTLFPIRNNNEADEWTAYTPAESPYACMEFGRKLGWKFSEFNRQKDKLYEMIQNQCKKMMEAYGSLERSHIVCLHIGSLERGFANPNGHDDASVETIVGWRHNPDFCYRGFHLGLMGCIRVLEVLTHNSSHGFDPTEDLIVLTEFGEELLGNRKNICTILSKLSNLLPGWKNEPSVIPSEVTLHIRLDSEVKSRAHGIMCSYCDVVHDWTETIGEEGPGEIINYLVKGAAKGDFTNCLYRG